MQNLRHLFTDHPRSVDETYLEHLLFAAGFSARLAVAAMAALIHAILPFLCERTASRMVAELHLRTRDRGDGGRDGAAA